MDVSNITLNNLSTAYKGEIFIKVANTTQFNSIKSFVDDNNLVCFIEDTNTIYAQGHSYTGITPEQATQIGKITSIEAKLEKTGNQSIIGSLEWTESGPQGPQTHSANNVTEFVTAYCAAIQSGSADIGTHLASLDSEIASLESLLDGFPVIEGEEGAQTSINVKTYIDAVDQRVDSLVTSIAEAIASATTIVIGDYDELNNPSGHIKVTTVGTQGAQGMVNPFTFAVEGHDIASQSELTSLATRLNDFLKTRAGQLGINESIDLDAPTGAQGAQDAKKNLIDIIDEELARQLIAEDAAESLDTLQEIADWIKSHPEDVSAMNSSILALQQGFQGMQSNLDDYALKGELYTEDDQGNTILKMIGTSGFQYATTLEEVNKLLANISFVTGVEEGAQANWINGVNINDQSIKVNGENIGWQGSNGNTITSGKLLNATHDAETRTLTFDLDTNALGAIGNAAIAGAQSYTDTEILEAVTGAQTYTDTQIAGAQAYTDSRLAWVILEEPEVNP
jgi:hypothetical protein